MKKFKKSNVFVMLPFALIGCAVVKHYHIKLTFTDENKVLMLIRMNVVSLEEMMDIIYNMDLTYIQEQLNGGRDINSLTDR